MGLETGVNYLGDLVSTNPTGTDPKGQGDDHIRNTKRAAKQSFPGWTKAIMVTGTDTGSANTYVISPAPALVSLDAGTLVVFSPANSNTDACTLEITGFPAKGLLSVAGSALGPNEIVPGQVVFARYDGTDFRLVTISKQYADQLAFASALPAISALTIYQSVFNDGTGGLWKRALPESTAGNAGLVLKSTGTDGYPETSSSWEFDAHQGASAQSANFTLAASARGTVQLCSNTITVSLTAAATLGSKFYARLINVGTGLVTIDPNGSETITVAGQTAKSTIALIPSEGVDLFCDGSNWIAVVVQSAGAGPHLYAYQTVYSGFSANAWVQQNISAIGTNDLGASVSSNRISNIPVGVYRGRISIIGSGCLTFATRLYDNMSSTELFRGGLGYAVDFSAGSGDLAVYNKNSAEGKFTITSPTNSLALQGYASATGYAVGTSTSPLDRLGEIWLTRISP